MMNLIEQGSLIKTVIFDFDGTLVNSMLYWQRAVIDYLKGFAVTDEEGLISVIKPMGIVKGSEYIIEKYGLKVSKNEMANTLCNTMEEKYKSIIPLKPYAKQCAELLHNQGCNTCIATATDREYVIAVLKRTGLMEYIDYVVTIADVGASKDSPKIFLNCAGFFGSRPQECVVFEDSLMSCQVAKEAGFNVIGVSDDTNFDEAELMKQVCDRFINSFLDIMK